MQNSLLAPPKDQGSMSLTTGPAEKQLSQQMSGSPGKTVCTGESNVPSGTVQSRKGLQSKSQFRTIAPKLVPKVLPSRTLCDQGALGASLSSRPLGVPAQNYALMQVAGQEGTFSLVALPQPVQKPRAPLPETLKLPIPRYQPPRSTKGSRKDTRPGSPESGCHGPPALAQACPHTCPSAPAQPVLTHGASPCPQMPPPDQSPASIVLAALTNGAGHRDLRPPGTGHHRDGLPAATPAWSAPEGPSAQKSLPQIPGRASFTSKVPRRPPAVACEKLKDPTGHAKALPGAPAGFGGTVQLMPSIPKGKLQIVPYSLAKTAAACKLEPDDNTADFSLPGHRTLCDERPSVPEGFDAATRMASKAPVPQLSKQSVDESAFCPDTNLDLNHKTRLSSGAAKRRGRRRKVPEESSAPQGKRRRCIINKCRGNKVRVKDEPPEPRDRKPGAVKKYRSIMPKPVVVLSALAPLAPAAALPSQMPSGPGQDILLNNSLASKYLVCKQNASPAPKASSVCRNGCSGIEKPKHRCHICNHHFHLKRHLRDHMNMHTNRRPYSCRICRKAYVRLGSLSAHMKLHHHGESRPKRLMCCEFCAKVFGHVQVYFGHLREAHRVVITTEPTPSEPQPGDMPKSRDRGTEGPLQREKKSSLDEDLLLNQADDVKLQIKCGRCQLTAQSFAEMKFHLLCVHGEEIQGRLRDSPPLARGAQEALAVPATPERRKPGRACAPQEGPAPPKPKRQKDRGHRGADEPGVPEQPGPRAIVLWNHSGFNCLLCAQTLARKEELFLHWEHRHNCEDPSRLWAILSTSAHQGVIGLSSEPGK